MGVVHNAKVNLMMCFFPLFCSSGSCAAHFPLLRSSGAALVPLARARAAPGPLGRRSGATCETLRLLPRAHSSACLCPALGAPAPPVTAFLARGLHSHQQGAA